MRLLISSYKIVILLFSSV